MSMHEIWRERMSQWVVPNWDQSHQIRQRPSQAAAAAAAEEEEESNRSSHVHFPQKSLMSKYEAMAHPWRNQELLPTPSIEHSWDVETGDTLESIVRQATTTSDKQSVDLIQPGQKLAHMSSTAAPSDGKGIQSSRQEQMAMAPLSRKPTWSNPEILDRNTTNSMHAESENGDFSTCGGASATFCSDMDTTLITWPSPESPRSLKTNNTVEDLTPPWASEEEHNIKRITDGCRSTKRTRSATTHNQSERRRRDRINQKFKDLQKLVPDGNKTDTASLLDDTIQYLKQLQVQVQLMSSIRTMPQMIMALGMQQQQQLQMSLLARMGMGVGLLESDAMAHSTMQSIARLLHPTSAATTSHAFAPHQVLTPSMMPTTQAKAKLSTSAPVPPADPFCTFLAQPSMNMDLYSKMVTLYCQEVNRTPSQTGKSSESRHVRGNEIASKKKLQRFG